MTTTRSIHSAPHMVAVVDDDSGMRQAIRRILEIEGLMVEAFASAEEFLASGAVSRAECLVLDIRLPELSGLDLYERLLATGRRKPVVFITAQDDARLRRRATQRSSQYLVKPFLGETLIEAVHRSLSKD